MISKEEVLALRANDLIGQGDRMVELERLIDSHLARWKRGSQTTIPIHVRSCDMTSMQMLLEAYRGKGWHLKYEYDNRRYKEYILVPGNQ